MLARPGWSGPRLQAHLLAAAVPVIGRVRGDDLWLDVRSLLAGSHGQTPDELVAELATALSP